MRSVPSSGPILKRVLFYPGRGVVIESGGHAVAGKNPGRRGDIKGWTSRSRRRMREFMIAHEVPAGWTLAGATFTIPGPVLSSGREKALWADWSWRAARAGWCAVWRLEIQKRGARHWHCVVGLPPAERWPENAIKASWTGAIDRLGPFTFDPPYKSKNGVILYTTVSSLMQLPCASLKAVDVQIEGGRGAWLRYLQDHATKAKQAQIGESVGRHWGVVGRKHFLEVRPSSIEELPDLVFYRFLRAYQRMCTPSFSFLGRVKAKIKKGVKMDAAFQAWLKKGSRVPFGRSLGRRCTRGRYGSSVWFSRPQTVARLVEWAKTV